MWCVHTEDAVTRKELTEPSGALWEMPTPVPREMRRAGYKSWASWLGCSSLCTHSGRFLTPSSSSRLYSGCPQVVLQPHHIGGLVAVLLHVRPMCSLEAASSACQLSQGKVGLQTPQLLQAESKHAVSNIIEWDGAPESCPNRFPGNMYL